MEPNFYENIVPEEDKEKKDLVKRMSNLLDESLDSFILLRKRTSKEKIKVYILMNYNIIYLYYYTFKFIFIKNALLLNFIRQLLHFHFQLIFLNFHFLPPSVLFFLIYQNDLI